jgi:hypothetical protein
MSVLRRQASHLLLIRTNLGCGTALTAACARPGCRATDYHHHHHHVNHHHQQHLLFCMGVKLCLSHEGMSADGL